MAYAFTSFDFPGGYSTRANDINDLGQIVGYHSDSRGFLKDGPTYTELHASSLGATTSFAFGINNLGQITGMYRRPDTSFHQHGFLLSSLGFEEISLSGASDSSANKINDTGQIAGHASIANLPEDLGRGFVKTGDTYEVLHATPLGATRVTYALGINNQGDVIGVYGNGDSIGHAFLKDSNGYHNIDVPGGSPYTNAQDINSNGEIVGGYSDTSGVIHGFVLSASGYETIDFPGAAGWTHAMGINSRGDIVGDYRDSNGRFHAFLATKIIDVMPVSIDIKPGSATNPINLNANGVIPIAVLTTAEFDATGIDVASVRFASAGAIHSALEDIDFDGDLDLVLQFRLSETNLVDVYTDLLREDLADGTLDSNHQVTDLVLSGRYSRNGTDFFSFLGADSVDLFMTGARLRELLRQL